MIELYYLDQLLKQERNSALPGDMKEVDPYLRPLYDALYELFGADKIDKKIEAGEIEIAPLAFMRGRTLKIVSQF